MITGLIIAFVIIVFIGYNIIHKPIDEEKYHD